MGGYTSWFEAYVVTLIDRCSFLCVSGQRGTIAKSMHEDHLRVVALTSNGARNPVLSACLLPLYLCDSLLLFVYFQVNNGVVCLDYEDSHHGPLLCSFQLLYWICLYCLICIIFVFPFVGVPACRLM